YAGYVVAFRSQSLDDFPAVVGTIIVDQHQLVALKIASSLLLDSSGKLRQTFSAFVNRHDDGELHATRLPTEKSFLNPRPIIVKLEPNGLAAPDGGDGVGKDEELPSRQFCN